MSPRQIRAPVIPSRSFARRASTRIPLRIAESKPKGRELYTARNRVMFLCLPLKSIRPISPSCQDAPRPRDPCDHRGTGGRCRQVSGQACLSSWAERIAPGGPFIHVATARHLLRAGMAPILVHAPTLAIALRAIERKDRNSGDVFVPGHGTHGTAEPPLRSQDAAGAYR